MYPSPLPSIPLLIQMLAVISNNLHYQQEHWNGYVATGGCNTYNSNKRMEALSNVISTNHVTSLCTLMVKWSYVHCSTCLLLCSLQYMLVVMFTAARACRYVHRSTCLSLRSPQHMLVVMFTAARACRYVHCSTCLSLRSLQYVLVVTFIGVRACRYVRCGMCMLLCSLQYVFGATVTVSACCVVTFGRTVSLLLMYT